MNEAWKNFLLREGLSEDLHDFGDAGAERSVMRNGNLCTALTSRSLIRVAGPDAKTFLNNQLTNDLGSVTPVRSQLSAWCSAQGRMLAVLRVILRDEGYLLILPTSLRDDIVKRLRMYVLRAKVTVETVDDLFGCIGLTGPDAEALVTKGVAAVPGERDACAMRGAVTALRLPGLHPRFEILAPPAEAGTIWESLRGSCVTTGVHAWNWHDIMAGIPTVLPPTREEFVPQMANLELLDGVNFKKGCYPGQEIVARMQYLGRLKQRMYRAHVSGKPVAPGTPIYAPSHGDQAAGQVMLAAAAPEAGCDLLAVIQIASVETGRLRLGNSDGPILEILPLPYTLPATA